MILRTKHLKFIHHNNQKQNMSEPKTPVDTYLTQFSGETRERLDKIRKLVKETAPEAEEIISYGIPTYKQGQNLVHFAGYKKHIGFYPTPSGIEAFREETN